MSVGGILQRSNKKEPAPVVPPATVTAANNGLSLSGTIAQLGNGVGLNTAVFINDREIPMGAFSFLMHQAGNRFFYVDPQNQRFFLGDVDGAQGSAFVDIDNNGTPLAQLSGGAGIAIMGDTASVGNDTTIGLVDTGLQPRISMTRNGNTHFLIDFNSEVYELGDDNYANNGGLLKIDDNFKNIDLGFGLNNQVNLSIDDANQQLSFGDVSGSYLLINIPVGQFYFGDISGVIDGSGVFIDDTFGVFNAAFNTTNFLWVDNTDRYTFGKLDAAGVVTGTGLTIDDANQLVTISSGGVAFLSIDAAGRTCFIGDSATGSYVNITDSGLNAAVDLLAKNGALFAEIIVGGNAEQVEVIATNGLKITGDTTLLHTGTALSNNAGAGAGTLTNAPTAGNPTKWIAIDDNGTQRFIPTWT